jgi:hypothetical protein
MTTMANCSVELSALIDELATITKRVRQSFGGLNAVQLNWRPDRAEWSIAQCLEHLVLINAPYLPILEGVARGDRRPTLRERVPILPRIFGRLVLRAVQPDARRKIKARPRFEPSASAIAASVVERFAAHQAELSRVMAAAAGRDLATTIIASPGARFVTYSALDACYIIVAHEQQHVGQADRVLTALRSSAWG